MLAFVIRRSLEALVTLLAATIIVFVTGRFSGDPALLLVSTDAANPAKVEQVRAELGLNRPLPEQYGLFLVGALHGDFGRSFFSGQPVSDTVTSRIGPSITLSAVSVLLALIIAVPAGVLAAVHRGSPFDVGIRLFAALGQAMPSFWLGLVLVLLFSVDLGWFPVAGADGPLNYVLPAFTIAWFISAGVVRLLRSSMIELLSSDYVRFARSFGMSERGVIWTWAFPNALIPVISFMGFMVSIIVAGSVVVEVIFAWPGLGRLSYDAVLERDFPVLQAVVLIWAAFVIVVSWATDLLQASVDPRVRA